MMELVEFIRPDLEGHEYITRHITPPIIHKGVGECAYRVEISRGKYRYCDIYVGQAGLFIYGFPFGGMSTVLYADPEFHTKLGETIGRP